uniref:Uncharacterized protein n=1 Tax=Mola mola TaxID=94237 RepID=A0A3Q4B590_MOLML
MESVDLPASDFRFGIEALENEDTGQVSAVTPSTAPEESTSADNVYQLQTSMESAAQPASDLRSIIEVMESEDTVHVSADKPSTSPENVPADNMDQLQTSMDSVDLPASDLRSIIEELESEDTGQLSAVTPSTAPEENTPASMESAALEKSVGQPETCTESVDVPETCTESVDVPETCTDPVDVPETCIDPVDVPETCTESVDVPETCIDPVDVPETCIDPVDVPETCIDPVDVPETCIDPVDVPETCIDPVDVPETCIDPVDVPETCTESVDVPETCTESVDVPETCTESVDVPETCTDPVDVPETCTDPVDVPETSAESVHLLGSGLKSTTEEVESVNQLHMFKEGRRPTVFEKDMSAETSTESVDPPGTSVGLPAPGLKYTAVAVKFVTQLRVFIERTQATALEKIMSAGKRHTSMESLDLPETSSTSVNLPETPKESIDLSSCSWTSTAEAEENVNRLHIFVAVLTIQVLNEFKVFKNVKEKMWLAQGERLINQTIEGLTDLKGCCPKIKTTKKLCKVVVKDLQKMFYHKKELKASVLLQDPEVEAAIVQFLQAHISQESYRVRAKKAPLITTLFVFKVLIMVVSILVVLAFLPLLL